MSTKSATQSIAPSPLFTKEGSRLTYVELAPPAPPPKNWGELLAPSMPGFAAALFAILAVHRLTRSRDREKLVLDVDKQIVEQLGPLKEAAIAAWASPKCKDRASALAETIWRMQRVGASCARLTAISKRRRWSWGAPLGKVRMISTSAAVVGLRRSLTDDPFVDITQTASSAYAQRIEEAMGTFVAALDAEITDWVSATYR
jgi:hypothetical protein